MDGFHEYDMTDPGAQFLGEVKTPSRQYNGHVTFAKSTDDISELYDIFKRNVFKHDD